MSRRRFNIDDRVYFERSAFRDGVRGSDMFRWSCTYCDGPARISSWQERLDVAFADLKLHMLTHHRPTVDTLRWEEEIPYLEAWATGTPVVRPVKAKAKVWQSATDTEEEKKPMNRLEDIKARMRELEAEAAQLNRFGVDTYPDKTVLAFEKEVFFQGQYGPEKREATFAALKIEERGWYLTSTLRDLKVINSYDQLVQFMLDGRNHRIVETWKPVFTAEETPA